MLIWQKESKQDVAIKYILFVISPFFAFVYSLRSIKTRSSFIIFFLFAVLYGLALEAPIGKTESFTADRAAYRERFEDIKTKSKYEFSEEWKGFISFESEKKDFYFDTIAYYTSRITDNYHVLFMFFAVIFVFFMLKSLKIFIEEERFNYTLSTFILVYMFTINQLGNINGMRFWTAMWIATYSLLMIYSKGNKRYLLLALATPFIHVSFWVFIVILLLTYLFSKYEKVWFILLLASFIFSTIALELIQFIEPFLPLSLGRLISSYTNPEYIEMRNTWSGFGWVPRLFSTLNQAYASVAVYLFYINRDIIKTNNKTNKLFRFLLIWMVFVNFTMAIPSLGGRFLLLAFPLIAYVWLIHFKDLKYQSILYLYPIVQTWELFNLPGRYISQVGLPFYFTSPFIHFYKYIILA